MGKICYGCMKLKYQSPVCEHCGFHEGRQNQPHQLPLGSVLHGQYRVGRVLGQGGFGITYLGYDANLDIPVAIKEFFPSGIVSRDRTASVICTSGRNQFSNGMDRFLREAKILARLMDVPEIVKVYNFFEENGTAYIIMEYIQGLDLRTYLKRLNRLLTPEETFALLRPVMRGLEQVHRAGLVHRDISPDNIMLQKNGTVKLLDFGTARNVESNDPDAELAHSTQAILKYGFAPAEQYQSRGSLGPWTDEYALCATAYYCMTGRVPPEALDRLLGQKELDWSQVPGLSKKQVQALSRGMAIQAEDRFPSVWELEQAIFAEEKKKAPKQPKEPKPQKEPKPPKEPKPKKAPKPPREPKPKKEPKPKPEKAPRPPLFQKKPKEERQEAKPEEPAPSASDKPEPKPGKKKGRAWVAAAIVLALIAGIGAVASMPGSSAPAETAAATEADSWNLLKEYPIDYNYPGFDGFMDNYYVMPVFGSDYTRGEIASVTFLNRLLDMPQDAWDVSQYQDGSVMAWVEPNGELYDLYLAAEGTITAARWSEALFAGYINAEKIEFNGHLDTSQVEVMDAMFFGCQSLTSLDLSGFDTSSVTTMSFMFSSCESLTSLDLSGFDTSNVRFMQYMLDRKSNWTGLELGTWETDSVTEYQNFMSSGSQYKGEPWEVLFTPQAANILMTPSEDVNDFSRWADQPVFGSDYTRQEIATITFLNTLQDMPEDAWDVSHDQDGTVMAWVKPSGDLYDLYLAARGVITAPTDCTYLFAGYSSATNIQFGGNFHTGQAEHMAGMFSECDSLTSLDLSGFDTSNVMDMDFMFSWCKALRELNISGFDTSSVTDMTAMFQVCTNLQELDVSGFDTSHVTFMSHMFFCCAVLEELNVSGFDTSSVTYMAGMFGKCTGLHALDLSDFDTSNVTNMEEMFLGLNSDISLELGDWETDNVEKYDMFMKAGALYKGKPWEDLFTK